MKKLYSIILMAAVAFAACTKENAPVTDPTETDQVVTINATIAGDTKVALGEGENEKKVNWTEGDIINLTINESEYSFTWKEGTIFEYKGGETLPSLEENMVITAVYAPVFSTTQTGLKADVGNYMSLSADITVESGQSYKDLNFVFDHKTSVLKLTLSNDDFKGQEVTGITVKAGSTVVAKATATFEGDAENGSVTAYLAIEPATLENVSIHATCGENTYFASITDKTLTSGKLYKATATLASACFLPEGTTFRSAINTFLENNTTLTKIMFIADPTWTPTGDQIGTCGAYMVANDNTLEIRTPTSCFVFHENCSDMFYAYEGIDWNTYLDKLNKLADITSIDFNGCIKTNIVTDMQNMFGYCKKLISVDLEDFNTSNVTTMTSMFTNCTELLQISLSNIKTEKVEDMSFMFYRCNKLEQLNLSSFNTNNVTTMRGMFGFCNKLNTINFGNNFNTAKVTDMGYMFQGVNSTNDTEIDLDLTGFTFTAGVDITEIFDYTTGPIRVKVTETGYNVLKGISLVNITYVKPDGTPWESNAN